MSKSKRSIADHVDMHRRLLFLTMLLMSVVFAVKTATYLVDDTMDRYLGIAAKILAALAILVLLLTIYWKLRFIPRKDRYYFFTSTDSFVSQVMNRAGKSSWLSTLLLLILITSIIKKSSTALPAQFYVDLTLFFMLATYSISFFYLFHGGREEKN